MNRTNEEGDKLGFSKIEFVVEQIKLASHLPASKYWEEGRPFQREEIPLILRRDFDPTEKSLDRACPKTINCKNGLKM